MQLNKAEHLTKEHSERFWVRQRRLCDILARCFVQQGHLFAGRHAQRIPLDGRPERAVLGPSAGLQDLLFDALKVFDDVSRYRVLSQDYDLNDLVEVHRLQLEGLQQPGESQTRVEREAYDLQAAGEQGLMEEILREEVVVGLVLVNF